MPAVGRVRLQSFVLTSYHATRTKGGKELWAGGLRCVALYIFNVQFCPLELLFILFLVQYFGDLFLSLQSVCQLYFQEQQCNVLNTLI